MTEGRIVKWEYFCVSPKLKCPLSAKLKCPLHREAGNGDNQHEHEGNQSFGSDAKSWKPIILYVTIIFGLYLYFVFSRIIILSVIAVILTLILIVQFLRRDQAHNRDLLIFQIWRRRISDK